MWHWRVLQQGRRGRAAVFLSDGVERCCQWQCRPALVRRLDGHIMLQEAGRVDGRLILHRVISIVAPP